MVRWYEGPARRDSGLVQLVGRRAKAERLATHHATHDCESECNGTRAGAPAGRSPGAVTTVRLNNKIRDRRARCTIYLYVSQGRDAYVLSSTRVQTCVI